MKTKTFFLGLAFFTMGIMTTIGMAGHHPHHSDRHQASIRKSAVIEVGAPLTVSELKYYGFI